MDVIDLDYIENTANPYGYIINSDFAKYSTISIPKAMSVQDEIKDIKEQIADIYNQLDKLKKPLRCKSLL